MPPYCRGRFAVRLRRSRHADRVDRVSAYFIEGERADLLRQGAQVRDGEAERQGGEDDFFHHGCRVEVSERYELLNDPSV